MPDLRSRGLNRLVYDGRRLACAGTRSVRGDRNRLRRRLRRLQRHHVQLSIDRYGLRVIVLRRIGRQQAMRRKRRMRLEESVLRRLWVRRPELPNHLQLELGLQQRLRVRSREMRTASERNVQRRSRLVDGRHWEGHAL
jgi:hypothetical protein